MEFTEAERAKVEELKKETRKRAEDQPPVKLVPRYQNFVPGKGHTRLPSFAEVQAAQQRGEDLPEAEVTAVEHRRDNATQPRKNDYQNFTPGPDHKLMHPARVGREEPAPTPTGMACTTCEKRFDSMRALRMHSLKHREKGE